MRLWFCFLVSLFIYGTVAGQDNQPKIRDQSPDPIRINEDESFTIQLTNLEVRDRDDWFYPWGFTLKVYPGDNYTLEGNKVIANADYSGNLSVPVTVNDGDQDSDEFNVKIVVKEVNDLPVITSQVSLSINENQSLELKTSHLVIKDPDDTQFTLIVSQGSNYTVSNQTITPANGFSGTLTVPVKVNDGEGSSATFNLQVSVVPTAAVITGQVPLSINEDASLDLQLSHLTVKDNNNRYPSGFTIQILEGNKYTSSGSTVTPQRDLYGDLSVNITVSDGNRTSNVYPLVIQINPINDAPEITDLETEPIIFEAGKGPVAISELLDIYDPDDDSLTQAEIGFEPATYRYGFDELMVQTGAGISGSFNRDRGKIVLSGRALKSEYVKVIRSIRYHPLIGDEPLQEIKRVYITASDDQKTGASALREITPYSIAVDLDIPTAFTPNGDLSNDTWSIKALKRSEELSKAIIRIYNKSGKLIYEAVGIDKEWDGRINGELLPADSYFYTIDLGINYLESSIKGIVTLLR